MYQEITLYKTFHHFIMYNPSTGILSAEYLNGREKFLTDAYNETELHIKL